MFYSGIDLHKHFSIITTVDEEGVVKKQMKVNNSTVDILNYFAPFRPDVHAVVEATAGWYWLDEALKQMNIPLTLAHAKFLKAIAYAKVKTDKVDSATMAQLLRMNYIPEAYKLDKDLRPLRDLMRTRLRLVSKKVGCQNSIHRLLEKFNLNLEQAHQLNSYYSFQYRLVCEQKDFLTEQVKAIESSLVPTITGNKEV